MMNDKEYAKLQLRVMIVPQQAGWPAPDARFYCRRCHDLAYASQCEDAHRLILRTPTRPAHDWGIRLGDPLS